MTTLVESPVLETQEKTSSADLETQEKTSSADALLARTLEDLHAQRAHFQEVTERLIQEPAPYDHAKIERIRAEIAQGTYLKTESAKRIAEKMLAYEHDLS